MKRFLLLILLVTSIPKSFGICLKVLGGGDEAPRPPNYNHAVRDTGPSHFADGSITGEKLRAAMQTHFNDLMSNDDILRRNANKALEEPFTAVGFNKLLPDHVRALSEAGQFPLDSVQRKALEDRLEAWRNKAKVAQAMAVKSLDAYHDPELKNLQVQKESPFYAALEKMTVGPIKSSRAKNIYKQILEIYGVTQTESRIHSLSKCFEEIEAFASMSETALKHSGITEDEWGSLVETYTTLHAYVLGQLRDIESSSDNPRMQQSASESIQKLEEEVSPTYLSKPDF